MSLRFHNTLTGAREEFVPLVPGRAGVYTCGPTVWNLAHVGNFRGNLFYDLLRRHLRFSGYDVHHVMNITDVDDRILHEAMHAGTTIRQYTERFAQAFFDDLAALRFQPADLYPRATDHVPDMVRLVDGLLAGGHAYEADGDVYFRVDSFPAYGRLSRMDRAGLRAGIRVATDKYEKESATDFALWKREQPGDAERGAAWPAPFGSGRPGWHIECSAMAMRYLGPTFDIHAGGVDLVFPHHENEIAQSEAFTGQTFARYWLHNEHLADATGAKMSKSLGNISTLRDLLAAGHDPVTVRFFLMATAHYRQKLKFDVDGLHQAAQSVRRLRDLDERLRADPPAGVDDAPVVELAGDARARYRAALDDDLNLPQAAGHVFEAVREANAALDRGAVGERGRDALRALLADADQHLDVLRPDAGDVPDADVRALIERREVARANRDFAESDRIRNELRERGIALEDSREGVRWRRVRE